MLSSTYRPQCVFCRIVAGEEPASVICEDDEILVFLDINPLTRGHALVVPKAHVVDIYGASDGQAAAMMITGARVARAARSALDCVGVNLWMANERPAGQVVMHAHLHVIPRYPDDGFGLRRWSTGGRPSRAELDQVAARIGEHLEGH